MVECLYFCGMKVYVSELGFILMENNEILKTIAFKDFLEYKDILEGEKTISLDNLVNFLKEKKVKKVYVNLPSLIPIIKNYNLEVEEDEEKEKFEEDKVNYLIRGGLCSSEEEALEKIREVALKVAKEKLKETSARLDLHIIQSINALEELDKIINLMGMRVKEWYSLHFPELKNIISDLKTYCKLIETIGSREGNFEEFAISLGLSKAKALAIEKSSKESKGGDISLEHLKLIKALASETLKLIDIREDLAESIEKTMRRIAPNLTSLAGALVGARLIAKAGGLDKLARLPASTIQVLGAEKALFRALKTRSKPPKHGVIFQHPLIHSSPKKLRGKMARALATKLAIAARLDYFKGEKDDRLKKDLEERVKEIRRGR